MTKNPEEHAGVGEAEDHEIMRTEFLDFLAKGGLKKIYLLTSHLRRLNQDYPHRTELAGHTFFLDQLTAFGELGLKQSGYTEKDIMRAQKSNIVPKPEVEA